MASQVSILSAEIIGVYHHGGASVLTVFSFDACQLSSLGFCLFLFFEIGVVLGNFLLVLRSPTVFLILP